MSHTATARGFHTHCRVVVRAPSGSSYRQARASAATNATFAELEADLRTVVDYPSVARDVADYGQKMFAWWAVNGSHMGHPSWEQALNAPGLRWDASWDADAAASLAAVKAWRAGPPEVLPCLADQVYPPKE